MQASISGEHSRRYQQLPIELQLTVLRTLSARMEWQACDTVQLHGKELMMMPAGGSSLTHLCTCTYSEVNVRADVPTVLPYFCVLQQAHRGLHLILPTAPHTEDHRNGERPDLRFLGFASLTASSRKAGCGWISIALHL
jgi:hypothetical protein